MIAERDRSVGQCRLKDRGEMMQVPRLLFCSGFCHPCYVVAYMGFACLARLDRGEGVHAFCETSMELRVESETVGRAD